MYERMLDKQNKPAFDDMAAYCGKGMELFIRINEWLSDTCGTVQEDYIFPMGINMAGLLPIERRKADLQCVCGEWRLYVMIRLSNAQFHLVYDQVEKETQECIDNKYPCGDGGWIHYRVAGEAHFCDIQKLLEMKCLS